MFEDSFVIVDLETTGLSPKNGEIIDTFECFVNPEKPIPEEVVAVTHITDEMVKDAPKIEEVLPKMIEFIGDSVVVTHNTDFYVAYLKHNYEVNGFLFET